MEKQKRKVDDERSALTSLNKELQTAIESCEELERKRQKCEHELHTRDNHIICLEGQLTRNKSVHEAELNKVILFH